jgi:predicted Zn-dependent peptidase
MELYRNMGIISVSYEIPPALLLPSVRLLLDTLAEVKRGIGDALDYVRAPYTDNAYLMYDSEGDFNWSRAYESQILRLPYRTVAERAAAYAAVTEGDVVALARRLFVPDGMTLTVKGDKKRVDTDALCSLLHALS